MPDEPVYMTSSATAVLERLVPTSRGVAALIVNSAKFPHVAQAARFRAEVDNALAARGWAPAQWLPTTEETRGADEARRAIADRVDLVLVAGGDGTVRTVSQELVGTGIPMAVIPLGTGNLLARNLGVPLRNVSAAVATALDGHDRSIDVGWLDVDYDGDGRYDAAFAFLVMAGAGFDAAIMAGADGAMKAQWGTSAYIFSGARASRRTRSAAVISSDGIPTIDAAAHGFVVGNFGSLTMGMQLMPDADPNDGLLDTVVLLPGTFGEWVRLSVAVLTRRRGTQRVMPRLRGRDFEYRSDERQPVEVDGDVIGLAHHVRARVQDSALIVRAA